MTAVGLYIDLVASAFDATQAEETRRGMEAYYVVNKRFAFAAALRLLPRIDVEKAPIQEIITSLRQAVQSGELAPGNWYTPAIESAWNEFYEYKSYVSTKLSFMHKTMAATGEFDRWSSALTLRNLRSPLCWMWQRVPSPRIFNKFKILDANLPARILSATPPVIEPRKKSARVLRPVVLSSVRVYMEMTKSAVLESLKASMREAVQLRFQRMAERGQPSAESAGIADLIPDFAPTRVALDEVPSGCRRRRPMLRKQWPCTANTQTQELLCPS